MSVYVDSFVWCVKILLALVFVTSVVGQLRAFTTFYGVLANYRLLPQWAIAPVQFGLPAVQTLIAVALIVAPRWGAPAAAALLLLFASAMAINLLRGRSEIDCGCHHGALRQKLRWSLVVRNCVLAGGAVASAIDAPAPEPAFLLSALAAAACAFLLYMALDHLSMLGPVPRRRRIRVLGGAQ